MRPPAARTYAGYRATRLGYRGIGGGCGEQSTAEFGSECRSLGLDFEKNADDLPISRSPQAEAAGLEPLMIEPSPHAVHPVVHVGNIGCRRGVNFAGERFGEAEFARMF